MCITQLIKIIPKIFPLMIVIKIGVLFYLFLAFVYFIIALHMFYIYSKKAKNRERKNPLSSNESSSNRRIQKISFMKIYILKICIFMKIKQQLIPIQMFLPCLSPLHFLSPNSISKGHKFILWEKLQSVLNVYKGFRGHFKVVLRTMVIYQHK